MVLAPKLTDFLLRNPELELRIETRDRIADLVSDGFDLAVRFGEPAPSALIARRVLNARILTVASPLYIERHDRPRRPQDLASDPHQCIFAIDHSTGRPFDWEFSARKRSHLPERNLNNGQPYLHAQLIASASPQSGEHVVHIGAGVGYYTAILRHLVGGAAGSRR